MTLTSGLLGLALVTLTLAVAASCRRAPEYAFQCPGGAVLRVRYPADSVEMRLPDGVATLPIARSASGARYANDTLEFWEHAGEVRVTRHGRILYEGCRRVGHRHAAS